MITITLPDGSKRPFETPPSVYDVAASIGAGLAKAALAGKVDGKLVVKSPRRVFCDEKGQPLQLTKGVAGRSGRRKLCVTDWDGDGQMDFLLNSSSANLLRQVGTKDGKWLFKDEGPLVKQNIEGHDVSPTTVDFDADGVPDFLGGAEDGKFYFLKNPRSAK